MPVIKTNGGKIHTVLDRRDVLNLIADEFSCEVRDWLEEDFENKSDPDEIENLKDEISSLESDLEEAEREIADLTEKLADIRDILH